MQDQFAIMMGVQRFERAASHAFWQEIFARLRGQDSNLQSFEEVRVALNAWSEQEVGLRDIPMARIVGSVGRHKDFTHTFLPKPAVSRDRWSRIFVNMMGEAGLPPIEVYQLGDYYYVRDGNHRVSVARALGFDSIQAYVTEVRPLLPDSQS